jgi:pimeloyl-ACP methyl ester carboxylesterase
MGRIESWQPLWGRLTSRWRVTAMDRRGRGTSGDTGPYDLGRECQDIAAVAVSLAGDGPVDVFAHSFGATCALGAAASGAPVRRLALYEPADPQTAPREWRDRVSAMIADGRPGPAMLSFLTEIIGLTAGQVNELRNAPGGYDVLPVVSATMPREARALASVDLQAIAAAVSAPVLLILGTASPAWAGHITRGLNSTLPSAKLTALPGHGHEAISAEPGLITSLLLDFFA